MQENLMAFGRGREKILFSVSGETLCFLLGRFCTDNNKCQFSHLCMVQVSRLWLFTGVQSACVNLNAKVEAPRLSFFPVFVFNGKESRIHCLRFAIVTKFLRKLRERGTVQVLHLMYKVRRQHKVREAVSST